MLLSSNAWAGEELSTETLRPGSAYESVTPNYRAVGIKEVDGVHRLYVVADPADVLTQKSVNIIIQDALRRNPELTEIDFYSAVHDQPAYPTFAINDNLALYLRKDNKTHFSVAAKMLYGAWAYGPASLARTN